MNYNWDWLIFWAQSPGGSGTYLHTFVTGLYWTLAVAVLAWTIALVIGTFVGMGRTSRISWFKGPCTAYVELFRNVPLLVQLFIWYYVLPNVLPQSLGDTIKHADPTQASFWTTVVCLGLYTAPRIAEQVRAGILSVPAGQVMAGLSLGLKRRQVYRYVLLPMTARIILPPLTSEALNLVKNTSVAFTIGLLEITGVAKAMADFSFHIFEAFTAATILYLIINAVVVVIMHYVEKIISVPGFAGTKK